MVGKGKAIGAADRRRFRELQDIGCICCYLRGYPRTPIDVHHLLSGGRRLGHQHTLGLCPWHHRGKPQEPMTDAEAREYLGPSLAEGEKPFHEAFGSDAELYDIQATLIEQHRRLTR